MPLLLHLFTLGGLMATCPIPFSSPHDMERLVEGQRMLLVFPGDKSGSVVILLEER